MASKPTMSARPPSPEAKRGDREAFLSGATSAEGVWPWETPEAQHLASDKTSRKVVNIHFGYDYGLKLKFLRDRGVNIHRFLLSAASRAVDEEIARQIAIDGE